MKRHQLLQHLERCGCRLERERRWHSIYVHPETGARTTVPRHSEIDNRLAAKICRQLGVAPATERSLSSCTAGLFG
jgi:predicted RNA binding protein YcfA (HicA-like mRNA interferase family)